MALVLSPKDKIAAARIIAGRKMPYFTTALWTMAPQPAPGLGTMAVTEHAVLLYDPAKVDGWTLDETATVLLHEVSHLLRDHCGRCKKIGGEHKRWNYAADAEINDDLQAAGLKFPKDSDPVFPKHCGGSPEGLTAEAYYARLADQEQQGNDGKPQAGGGWCGSGGGRAVPDEPDASDEGSRSAGELARTRRAVAQAIQETVRTKGQGSVPTGLQRWANAILTPAQVRWQDKLARACRRAVAYRPGATDYRYDRPSRRQAAVGFGAGKPVLPRTVHPVPKVAIVVDTSGSMGERELTDALRETKGILSALGAPATFVSCDAAVHEMRAVTTVADAAKLLKGGGGTDFRPAFDALARERERADLVVFVTDGFGPAPAAAPTWCKVIWLLTSSWGAPTVPAPWGEAIVMQKPGDVRE